MISKFSCLVLCFVILQSDPVWVKGPGYEGYIFDATFTSWFSDPGQNDRFTPTKEEVKYAEGLLKNQIRGLNKSRENQTGNCPIIDKNLCKYKRQYVGLLNAKNEKILWVNFIWQKKAGSELSRDIISVYDGCSYYWQVKINLDSGEVYDLRINGQG